MKLQELKLDHARAHQPADDLFSTAYIGVKRGSLWQRDLMNCWVFPTLYEAQDAAHSPAADKIKSMGNASYLLPIMSMNGVPLLLQIEAGAYRDLNNNDNFVVLAYGPTEAVVGKLAAEALVKLNIGAMTWVYKTYNSDTSIFDLDEEDIE